MRFWLGGYAAGMGGDAEGISVLTAGDSDSPWASGRLGAGPAVVAAPGSPSWLTAHPALDVVYAALEDAGAVQAYRRTGETELSPLGAPVEAGEAVCHVAVSPDGGFLIASCWGDGRVVRMGLDADGRPGTPSIAPAATDPHGTDAAAPETTDEADPGASNARASHAHQALFLPGGIVATTDMGFDLVRFWQIGATGLRSAQEVTLPRGTGPRHMLWHPSGHLYVVAELSCEAFVLRPDIGGTWRLVSGTPLSREVQPGDTAAELTVSHDGHTLLAGVRGSDALAVLRVLGDGGALETVAFAEAGTHWPRHHLVVRDTVLVAGQRGSEVVSLPLDERTGVPGRVRHRAAAPSPTCILPFR